MLRPSEISDSFLMSLANLAEGMLGMIRWSSGKVPSGASGEIFLSSDKMEFMAQTHKPVLCRCHPEDLPRGTDKCGQMSSIISEIGRLILYEGVRFCQAERPPFSSAMGDRKWI